MLQNLSSNFYWFLQETLATTIMVRVIPWSPTGYVWHTICCLIMGCIERWRFMWVFSQFPVKTFPPFADTSARQSPPVITLRHRDTSAKSRIFPTRHIHSHRARIQPRPWPWALGALLNGLGAFWHDNEKWMKAVEGNHGGAHQNRRCPGPCPIKFWRRLEWRAWHACGVMRL
jgi:hypothetical protein